MSEEVEQARFTAQAGLVEGFVWCSIHKGYLPTVQGTQVCAACVADGLISEDRAKGEADDGGESELDRDLAAMQAREAEWDRAYHALIDHLNDARRNEWESSHPDHREKIRRTVELSVLDGPVAAKFNAARNRERGNCAKIRDAAVKLRATDPDAARALRATAHPDSLGSVAALVAAATGITVKFLDTPGPEVRAEDPPHPGRVGVPERVHAPAVVEAPPVAGGDPEDWMVRPVLRPHVHDGGPLARSGAEDLVAAWCERGSTAEAGS